MTAGPLDNAGSGWRRHVDTVEGVECARWSKGRGRPVVLVHGIGPGTNGSANFEPVLEGLAALAEVHLIDLAGFGASARKVAPPFFDVALWVAQVEAVAATLERPLLVGNSIGGALCLKMAARGHAIDHVVTIGSPLRAFRLTPALDRFWTAPSSPRELAEAIRPMTAKAEPPPPALVAARYALFESGDYGAYFGTMLSDKQAAIDAVGLGDDEVAALSCALTIVHGRLDRAVPATATAQAFAALRPDADLVLLGRCGHNVAWERPATLGALLRDVLGTSS